MQKGHSLQFRYANTFAFKSRCKYCGTGPVTAFFVHGKDTSTENFKFIRKYGGGKYSHPHSAYNSELLSKLVSVRQFKVLHLFDRDTIFLRNLFVPGAKFEGDKDFLACRVECECGETCWAFTNSRRTHIMNRKSAKFLKTKSGVGLL